MLQHSQLYQNTLSPTSIFATTAVQTAPYLKIPILQQYKPHSFHNTNTAAVQTAPFLTTPILQQYKPHHFPQYQYCSSTNRILSRNTNTAAVQTAPFLTAQTQKLPLNWKSLERHRYLSISIEATYITAVSFRKAISPAATWADNKPKLTGSHLLLLLLLLLEFLLCIYIFLLINYNVTLGALWDDNFYPLRPAFMQM